MLEIVPSTVKKSATYW